MKPEQVIKAVKYLAIILVLIFLFVVWNALMTRCDNQIPEGSVVVRQSFIDSLEYIASLPPDTVKGDTVWIKGDPVYYPKPYPVPVYVDPADTSMKKYKETFPDPKVNLWVDLEVKGWVKHFGWHYTPSVAMIPLTIERKVPYPVKYEVRVPVPTRGFFFEGGIGSGFDLKKPAGSMEVFYLTKTAKILGLEAGYFQQPYFQFKFGTKF